MDVKRDLDEIMSLHENSIPLKRPRIQEPSVLFNDNNNKYVRIIRCNSYKAQLLTVKFLRFWK